MRCVSDAFSDGAVLAAAPVNHDYNGEERWEQWRRKSRSDNYNARDKIIGTRCTLPIISCISSRVTPTRSPQSPLLPSLLTTGNHGSYLWNPKRINSMTADGGLWSIAEPKHVCVRSFVECQRVLTRTHPWLKKHAKAMLLLQDGTRRKRRKRPTGLYDWMPHKTHSA